VISLAQRRKTKTYRGLTCSLLIDSSIATVTKTVTDRIAQSSVFCSPVAVNVDVSSSILCLLR
jgi:hypothetical protein